MAEKSQERSALWMVTKEPVLNEFVCYLTEKKNQLLECPDVPQTIVFSRSQVIEVQQAFRRMIQKGEAKLHRLCGLLAWRLLGSSHELTSTVIGRLPRSGERFELNRPVAKQEIYSRTDLDLGNWQLSRMRFLDEEVWEQASLVANFVVYQPTKINPSRVFKMISRIKAEEEVWAKTVDEIFNLDRLVKRDKNLRELSFYIKDVFGIKLIVKTRKDVERLFAKLCELKWESEDLARERVPHLASTDSLRLIEVKNHLGLNKQKTSGWQAIKAVFSWWDKTFEIQIQAVDVYFREQEYLTRESHAGFKERREKIRREVADQLPLFGFYMQLLQWLFISQNQKPPQLPHVDVVLKEDQ